MDLVKKIWPLSFMVSKKDIKSFIIYLVITLVACAVLGWVLGLLGGIPLIGWIFNILGGLVGLYGLVGVILCILVFLEVI